MKKLLLPGALVLLGSLSSCAQSVRFGLKAGVNYSNTYIPQITRPDRILGLAAGAFAQVSLSADGLWRLQPELLYSAKGSERQFNLGTFRDRLHYLELPVLAQRHAGGWVVEVGPQLSYLLAGRLDSFNGPTSDLRRYNRLVVGAVAGVGYQLPMGLGVTLRYANDLSRSFQGGERNTLYQLQLGYVFPGK
jgi:hypothetical protein